MIKAVIFDIGGVLQIQDVNGPLKKDVSKTFKIPEEVFESFRQEFEPKLLTGEWNEKRYWEELVRRTGSEEPIPNESIFLRKYKKISVSTKVFWI